MGQERRRIDFGDKDALLWQRGADLRTYLNTASHRIKIVHRESLAVSSTEERNRMHRFLLTNLILRTQVWILALLLSCNLTAGTTAKRRRPSVHRAAPQVTSSLPGIVRGGPWTEPTYADSSNGDSVAGEDLNIRRILVQALGPYNGSVVAVDPSTGRILSIVNQRLALGLGFQPCSTIKVSVALAALSEKVIEPETTIRLNGMRMDLTYALAHSNNYFFANLGRELGFEKVSYYAHQFGYGEKAGLNIVGEEAGYFPLAPPRNGGVSMLTSFGEEISQTPLQFAALMSAIANGGTLYCLQYPRNTQEVASFTPKVKRQLRIEAPISGIIRGLRGAVEGGTARLAHQEEPIAGKTGTCSEDHAHLGWFGAFNRLGRRLVVVVLLRGGRQATGARAAAIAGDIYRQLGEKNYFAGPSEDRPSGAPPSPHRAKDNFLLAGVLLLLCSSAILALVWRKLRATLH
jgi:penicillin-binding protein 2